MSEYFEDYDFTDFWDDDEYAHENYIEPEPSDALIASIAAELGGYKMPASYIAFMKRHNGGMPLRKVIDMKFPDQPERSHFIEIEGFLSIGRDKIYSLCGRLGSNYMTGEGGIPKIGFCICYTISAGHDMIMLDYQECGPSGEPRVVRIFNDDDDGTGLVLADNFEAFIYKIRTARADED